MIIIFVLFKPSQLINNECKNNYAQSISVVGNCLCHEGISKSSSSVVIYKLGIKAARPEETFIIELLNMASPFLETCPPEF